MAGIFKAYDIRGLVPEPLDATLAHRIGRAFGELLGSGTVLVSHDMRPHSPDLTDALILGLREAGRDVILVGLGATPMNYWANLHYKVDASVSVTASHNGKEYNGFKFSRAEARPVGYDNGIGEMEGMIDQWIESGDLPPRELGSLQVENDTLDAYMDAMDAYLHPLTRPLKIAVDCANGMGGHFMHRLFERHPELTAVPLYWELDGTFPNHEADPLKPENLIPVSEAVAKHGCDFGASFDGDADRCMFVDEAGRAVSSDLFTALISEDVLAEHPGATILYDLRSSKVVAETVETLGGTAVRGRVGHAFMKQLMRDKGARFGGELSGHYYFAECGNTDSGLMALIRMINRMQATEQPLSQQVAPLRRYHSTGEINFRVRDAQAVQTAIENHFTVQGASTDHLDGLTITFDDWWFNLRSSNTEPLLRLNLEADSGLLRDARLAEVRALIEGDS